MARKRSRRLRRIAQQTASVKFGPERQQMESALMESGAARDSAIEAARATGRGLRSAIKQARPNFAKTYDEGARRLAGNAGLVTGNIPQTAAAAGILAAAAGEHQAAVDANAAERTRTLADLTQQRVRAQEGATFAVNSARQQYQGDVAKVLQQLLGLSQREGEFAAAEFGRLRENALDRDLSNAKFDETKRHNRAGERAANERLKLSAQKGKGSGSGSGSKVSDAQLERAHDAVLEARSWAKKLKDAGLDRHEVADLLSSGRDAGEIDVLDSRGEPVLVRQPDGSFAKKTRKVPGVPKIGSQLMLSAALDQVYDGFVGGRNTRQLHQRGYWVRDLPLLSASAYRRRQRKRARQRGPIDRPPLAPGPNGQSRPT